MVTVSNNAAETAGAWSHFYICLGTQVVNEPHVGSSEISVDSPSFGVGSQIMDFIYVYLPVRFVSPALYAWCTVLKM